jgi:hypothetical protein
MKLRSLLIVCLAASAIALAGCGDDESSSNTTTTTANRGFEVNTPEGQVSLSLSGNLPPNWPDDFPIPSGAEPAGSGSLGGGTSTGFIGVYSTSESTEDTYNYYVNDAGLSVTSNTLIASVGNVGFSGDPSGNVTILPYNDETLIVVLLSQSSSGTTVADGGTTIAP